MRSIHNIKPGSLVHPNRHLAPQSGEPDFTGSTLCRDDFVFALIPARRSGSGRSFEFLNDINILPEQIRPYTQILIAIVFIGFTGTTAIRDYNFYPSDCCNFVQYDDTVALDWLDRNTASDARILIASTQMRVLPSGPSANSVGTDAGIWIPALTGRDITYAHFDIDFRSEDELEMLCQKQIGYIYSGGTSQSFNISQLKAKKDWYKPILSLPDAQLFQVTGCFK